jgi:hypothetical protein
MATKKKTTTPSYDWGDGKGAIHTISKEQHAADVQAKRNPTLIAPPPGSYDPNLDATERASGRGLDDLADDTSYEKTKNLSDYQIGLGGIDTASGRSLSELLTARQRGGEDYGASIAGVQRNYKNLGDQQAGAQRKAGVSLGGAVAQAAAKRAANEALDRAPIDTAYKRFTDDSTQAQTRLGEDTKTQKEALGLQYSRADDPLTNQLARAQREYGFFQQDTAAARQFQANQLGYDPQFAPPPKVKGVSGPQSLSAGPGVKGATKKKKGRTVTYGNSVTGP